MTVIKAFVLWNSRTASLIFNDLDYIWITGWLLKLSPSETLKFAKWDFDVQVCIDSHAKYWKPASQYSHIIHAHLFPYDYNIAATNYLG